MNKQNTTDEAWDSDDAALGRQLREVVVPVDLYRQLQAIAEVSVDPTVSPEMPDTVRMDKARMSSEGSDTQRQVAPVRSRRAKYGRWWAVAAAVLVLSFLGWGSRWFTGQESSQTVDLIGPSPEPSDEVEIGFDQKKQQLQEEWESLLAEKQRLEIMRLEQTLVSNQLDRQRIRRVSYRGWDNEALVVREAIDYTKHVGSDGSEPVHLKQWLEHSNGETSRHTGSTFDN